MANIEDAVAALDAALWKATPRGYLTREEIASILDLPYPSLRYGPDFRRLWATRYQTDQFISNLITPVAIQFPHLHPGYFIVSDSWDGRVSITDDPDRIILSEAPRKKAAATKNLRVHSGLWVAQGNSNSRVYYEYYLNHRNLVRAEEEVEQVRARAIAEAKSRS